MFAGYYKDPDKTAEVLTPDGWVHTGDAGFFDPKNGQLKIIDRAKDVGRLNDGTVFAPKYIENKLKFYPNIREAVAVGAGRDFVCAMINIDLTAVGSWAERNNVVYGSYQELAANPRVYDMIARHIDEVNRSLSEEEVMAGAQIRRFLILHKELDPDDGELTRTQKLRRGHIIDRYAPLVEAFYNGATDGGDLDRGHLRGRAQRRDRGARRDPRHASLIRCRAREDGARGMRAPSSREAALGEVLLAVEDVSLSFGGVRALTGVSFDIRKGEIRAIIGPNGAGKTSMLNVDQRLLPAAIRAASPSRARCARACGPMPRRSGGIARTFQNLALFRGMTTLDNILAGRALKMHCGFFWQLFRYGPALREEVEHRRRVEEIIDFLEIAAIRKIPVGRLPYGLQKRVELGRALAMEPDLLLLDEPMAGMNLEEKEDMSRFIIDVNQQYGTTIALIEHDMGVVMDLSDRVVVLDYGRKIADAHARRGQERQERDPRLSGEPHGERMKSSGHERRAARRIVSARDGWPRMDLSTDLRRSVRADGHGAGSAGADFVGRPRRRRALRADRARLRPDLQGVGRVQFRARHHGRVRCAHAGRPARARRAGLSRARRSPSWSCSCWRSASSA